MDIGVLPSESLSSFMSRRVRDVSLKKKRAGSGIEGNYAQLSKKGHCLIKQVMENRFPGSTCGEFPCCQDTDVCKKFF